MPCATATPSETSGVNTMTSFLTLEVTDFKTSTLFMKRLLALAVSNIAYLRNMFPEEAFGNRNLNDLTLKILSDNSSCASACEVVKWMKGCFDALDHKYLRQMMLGIHLTPGDHDKVIETYTFRFKYTNEGTSVTCNGEEVANKIQDDQLTKRQAVGLMRTLVLLTQNLDPLPVNSYLTMKLLYYDSVTPPDYEPIGFEPAMNDTYYFEDEPVTIKAGDVSTHFHSLKVRVKAEKGQFEMTEDLIPSQIVSFGNVSHESSEVASCIGIHHEIGENDENRKDELEPMDPSKDNDLGAAGSVTEPDEIKDDSNIVRCPCGYQEKEGLMMLCMKCNLWQHGVCFGVLQENEAPVKHLCEICYKTDGDGFEPNDEDFYNLSPAEIEAYCVWRRALVSVCELKTVQPSQLAKKLKIEKSVAVKIIERLWDEGFLVPGTGRSRGKKHVDKTAILQRGFARYIKGTLKNLSNDGAMSVDEVEKKTEELSVFDTSIPMHNKMCGKKNQVDELHMSGTEASASYHSHGQKRSNQDFEGRYSEPKFDDHTERTRKRKKASTCKSGITLQPE